MPRRKDKKRYELYFTNEEWKKVQWLARQYHARNYASFIRNRIMNGKNVFENIKDKDSIIKEINQIGNNINQIAHALNIIAKKTTATKQDMLQSKLLAKQVIEYQHDIYKILQEKLFTTFEEKEDDSNI